jgi:hypothetical protein
MKCRELISPPLEWPRMKLHKSRSARWLRTPLWPRLAISLALLCVPNTVLAHDIYSGLVIGMDIYVVKNGIVSQWRQ